MRASASWLCRVGDDDGGLRSGAAADDGEDGLWRLRDEGIAELASSLDDHRARLEKDGTLLERRRRNLRNEVLAICATRLRANLEAAVEKDDSFTGLLDQVVERTLDPASAARQILEDFETS